MRSWYTRVGVVLVFGLALIGSIGPAQASQKTFAKMYVGANAGEVDIDSSSETTTELVVGVKFTRKFGLEAGFADLGEYGSSDYTPPTDTGPQDTLGFGGGGGVGAGPVEAGFDIEGYRVSAMGYLPLADRWSLFGRAGMIFIEADGSGGESASDESPIAGVGAEWGATPRLGIRAEFQKIFEIADSDEDADVLTIGVTLRFGKKHWVREWP